MSAKDKPELVFEPYNLAAAEFVRDRLAMHNIAATGRSDYYPVRLFLRDGHGNVVGGLLGSIWADWLFISDLWIDEGARGKRNATRLMDAAEDYARQRGCHSVSLDTHSFQARPFYEKRGYKVFGTLERYPAEHKKFFLQKKL